MLIDKTYFIGEISIAQLSTQAVRDNLTVFINSREPEYLERALGYAFLQDYNDGITADEQRFKDIRDGAEYIDCEGITRKWKGFTNDDKISPIANYIYFWYRRDNVTFTAGVGEMQGKTDNAKPVSPIPKQVDAWNNMVKMTKSLHDFLLSKKDDDGNAAYPEFKIAAVSRELTKRINVFNL